MGGSLFQPESLGGLNPESFKASFDAALKAGVLRVVVTAFPAVEAGDLPTLVGEFGAKCVDVHNWFGSLVFSDRHRVTIVGSETAARERQESPRLAVSFAN